MGRYRRIGSEVAYGESFVGLDHVQPIHDIAVDELLLAARSPKIEFGDTRDRLSYSFYFEPFDAMDTDTPQRFVSVQLAHESEPSSWWLAVSLRTFLATKRHTNKLIRYRFEAVHDELMEAKKSVYMILGNAAITFDQNTGEPIETIAPEYKMYEKPLHREDCEQIRTLLSQTAGRALVTRS